MKILNVIFWLGMSIIVANVILREFFLDKVFFFVPSNLIGIGLVIFAWIMTQKHVEKYCGGCGKCPGCRGGVVAGTVYVDDPEYTAGLGWIL